MCLRQQPACSKQSTSKQEVAEVPGARTQQGSLLVCLVGRPFNRLRLLLTITPHPVQQKSRANRVFYLSIPPSIFTDVAAAASDAASSPSGWTRVIVEKPFGRDSESFEELSQALSRHLTEDQMFRIDHYLGKELIENLTVLLSMMPQACAYAALNRAHSPDSTACSTVPMLS